MRAVRAALVGVVTVPVALTACRGVIGYKPLELEEDAGVPEAGAHEAGAPDATRACVTRPRVLFSTPASNPFGALFLGNGYAYADLLGESASGPFGVVGCPATGCEASPAILSAPIQGGRAFISAGAGDGGLFYAFSTYTASGELSDAAAGRIERAAPDGTHVEVVASRLAYPALVAGARGNVYWTNDPYYVTETDAAVSWSVRTVPANAADGTTPTTLIQGFDGIATALFTDSKNVYVLGEDNQLEFGLFVCRLGAGSGGSCVGGAATEFLTNVYEDPSSGLFDAFAADGTYLYEAGLEMGAVTRYALADTSRTILTLASDTAPKMSIAVDAKYVYWSVGTGQVYYVPKDTPEAVAALPLVCGLSAVTALASDSTNVYVVGTNPADPSDTSVSIVPVP